MEAVSGAALTVQFADVGGRALLGMIRLLKDLKETPKRMVKLLQDVDKSVQRICSLQNAIQQPASLFTDLSTTQIQRLTGRVDDAYHATVQLQHSLEPLFRKNNSAVHEWAKKGWRSIISIQIERSIAENVARTERLNREVLSELQLIDLEMGANIKSLSAQIQSSVEASGRSTVRQFNSLATSNQRIQQSTQDTQHQLTHVQSDVTSMRREVGQLETLLENLTANFDRIDHRTQLLQERHNIETALQHENQLARAELTLLGDTSRHVTTENVSAVAVDRLSASRLTSENKNDLKMQVTKQLVKSPSFLKDVCEEMNLAEQEIARDFVRRRRSTKNRCDCRFVRNKSTYQKGLFSITYNSSAAHLTSCPHYKSHQRSWSCSLSAQLLPILQRAIETTFAATFGAGGNSIGMSLRYFGIVKRSESPAYKLFDSFQDRCARRISLRHSGNFEYLKRLNNGQSSFQYDSSDYFEWDSELAKAEFPKLRRDLCQLLCSGRVSASYSDESGKTLLHAVLVLAGLLGSMFDCLSDELRSLGELIVDAGVDIYAALQTSDYFFDRDKRCLITSPVNDTVFDIAANLAMKNPRNFGSIPLYEILGDFPDDQNSKANFQTHLGRHVPTRKAALLFLRRYPQLLDYYGYEQLEKAIVCRSLDQMDCILQKPQPLSQYVENSWYKLSPLEFAVGWPIGLQKLLKAGFSADEALRLSIYMGDLISTEILLASDDFPGNNGNIGSIWLNVLVDVNDLQIQEMSQAVIQALKRRRQTLAELAIEKLPEVELLCLKLLDEKTLDIAALNVYRRLKESSVDVPPHLNPASLLLHEDDHYSVYQSLFLYNSWYNSPPSLEILDSLFENGFESVDTFVGTGQTPLLGACNKLAREIGRESLITSINWLLDKGASPHFSDRSSFPNVLFYCAINYGASTGNDVRSHRKNLRHLMRRCALLFDPLCSDDCHCYCSLAGCLPFHMFGKDDDLVIHHNHCESITSEILYDALEWICQNGLDETQSDVCHEEFCRLGVFDRLGMKHTCCRYDRHMCIRTSMPEEDRNQLQEEDLELAEQLELIVQAYKNSRKKYAGNLKDFWKIWSQKLDKILPEFTPEQRWRHHRLYSEDYGQHKYSESYAREEREWHYERTKFEGEALAKMGYSRLDFIDVIKLHFADSLDLESSEPATNPSDSIDQLSETRALELDWSPPESLRGKQSHAMGGWGGSAWFSDHKTQHDLGRRKSI